MHFNRSPVTGDQVLAIDFLTNTYGQPIGDAYVELSDAEVQQQALEKNGETMNTKTVEGTFVHVILQHKLAF